MTLKLNIEIVLFVLVSYCLITFCSSASANTINRNAHVTNIISEHKHIVMLNPSVNTDKRYIFLGDFFTNIGKKADIRVAYSPQPGKKSRFDARWLYRIAKAYKINWRPLTLKTHSIVKRSSQIIFRDEVEAALIGELKSFGYHDNFEIEMGQQANRIHVATNEQPKITVDGLSINKGTGRFIGNLVIWGDKSQLTRIRLTGRLHKLVTVPVIARRLSRGDVISKRDIQWINIRERSLRRGYIEDVEKMIGLAAKRFIPAKSPLTENQLQRPKLIRKGSIVNISLVNAYMRLSTQGKSLEDGSLGDMIRIKNIKTKKIILAKVTGAETARINSFKNHKFQ